MTSPRYRIRFKHRHDPAEVKDIARAVPGIPLDVQAVTICEIEDSERRVIGTGHAFCSNKDTFVREKGRRVALADALDDAFPYTPGASRLNYLVKRTRESLWDLYFSRNEARFDPRRRRAA